MWKVARFFLGSCRVGIVGADPEWALRCLAEGRVALEEVRRRDALTIEVRILRRDRARAEVLCAKAMCRMEMLGQDGFGAVFAGLRRRWGFVLAVAMVATAGYVVPKFVLFYRVSGNERVPTEKILRELEEVGVGFGTYGPSIHPQELKNEMLRRIPELQWLTVRQSGMCAEVVVRERPEEEETLDRKTARNVVAARDGVVTEILCLDGNCVVEPGQAVKEGELLVSAYMDLGFKTRVTAARAEVYARTVRQVETVLPETMETKVENGEKARAVTLLIGKKRIFLWGNSSIPGDGCDKITKQRMLTLPGGYVLPVGLEVSEATGYACAVMVRQETAVREAMEALCAEEIREALIAGVAEQVDFRLWREDGVFRLRARAECEEMIARQTEVVFRKDGEA